MTVLLIIYVIGFALSFVHGSSLEFDDGTRNDGILVRTVGALLWPLIFGFVLLLFGYAMWLKVSGKKKVTFYWRKNAKGNSHGRS